GREGGWVESLGIKRRILSITCAQQKKDQSQRLQKNADEDCAIRHGEENFFFPERREQVKHHGRKHGGEHQQHQPAEIGDGHKQANAAREEHFLLVLQIPCGHV